MLYMHQPLLYSIIFEYVNIVWHCRELWSLRLCVIITMTWSQRRPPSELKIQGIVSSQTKRQAELTSRSSTGLMQWTSAVRSIISSYRGEQLPSAAKSIPCKHQCKEEKLTSASRHQEEGSSSTTVIILQREFQHHCRAEDHQSVIMLDYTFLTNPHRSSPLISEECHQDIGEKVSSEWVNQIHHIKQQKSSWANRAHQSITFIMVHNIAFSVLLHLHQVWPVHPGSLLDLHLHLHLLFVYLALLSVLGRAQPSHLEDRDRPPQHRGVHPCKMVLLTLHLAFILHIFIMSSILNQFGYYNTILNKIDFINFMFHNSDYLKIISKPLRSQQPHHAPYHFLQVHHVQHCLFQVTPSDSQPSYPHHLSPIQLQHLHTLYHQHSGHLAQHQDIYLAHPQQHCTGQHITYPLTRTPSAPSSKSSATSTTSSSTIHSFDTHLPPTQEPCLAPPHPFHHDLEAERGRDSMKNIMVSIFNARHEHHWEEQLPQTASQSSSSTFSPTSTCGIYDIKQEKINHHKLHNIDNTQICSRIICNSWIQHQQRAEGQQQHQLPSISRRESQHPKSKIIIRMVIKEGKVEHRDLRWPRGHHPDPRDPWDHHARASPEFMSHHKWQHQHEHLPHEPHQR